ncbi:MAG: hypothetical protein IJN77_05940 [Oscillospiraceae bacterium]|nr:hypothetical protein [Oscillospiraceae bacterium]
MIDFNKYFNDEYQFTLKNAAYSWLENNGQDVELELNISDTINTAIVGKHLEVTFQRKAFFKPEALYAIDVCFSFTLTFRNDNLADEAKSINWSEALVENDNPYLGNVISRTSYLIATLTSSYGQQPLVTPPSIIRQ